MEVKLRKKNEAQTILITIKTKEKINNLNIKLIKETSFICLLSNNIKKLGLRGIHEYLNILARLIKIKNNKSKRIQNPNKEIKYRIIIKRKDPLPLNYRKKPKLNI